MTRQASAADGRSLDEGKIPLLAVPRSSAQGIRVLFWMAIRGQGYRRECRHPRRASLKAIGTLDGSGNLAGWASIDLEPALRAVFLSFSERRRSAILWARNPGSPAPLPV